MRRLESKVALVTGAASGVGRAMALRCAAEGAAVLCADRNEAGATETVARIEAAGGRAAARLVDVSREHEVAAALREAVERFGRLDVLMNNAEVGGAAADWSRTIAVNLEGVYHGLVHGAALLSEQGGGAIVKTASVGALVALRHHRLPRDGGALPSGPLGGGIDTPMLRGDRAAAPGDPSTADAIQRMRRIAQPEEIAAAAVFLASDVAAFITGIVLPVDGGYTAA